MDLRLESLAPFSEAFFLDEAVKTILLREEPDWLVVIFTNYWPKFLSLSPYLILCQSIKRYKTWNYKIEVVKSQKSWSNQVPWNYGSPHMKRTQSNYWYEFVIGRWCFPRQSKQRFRENAPEKRNPSCKIFWLGIWDELEVREIFELLIGYPQILYCRILSELGYLVRFPLLKIKKRTKKQSDKMFWGFYIAGWIAMSTFYLLQKREC